MNPAPPVTSRRIRGRLAAHLREACAQSLTPVREMRRARRSLRSTEYAGLVRGGPARPSRSAGPGSRGRLLEDRLGEVRPRAVAVRSDVPEPRGRSSSTSFRWRPPDGRRRSAHPRWSSTTATSSRSAPSRSIVRRKLCPVEPKSHDVRTIHASARRQPRRGASSARTRTWIRPVGLDVRRALATVEDVIGRERHERERRALPRSPSRRRSLPRPLRIGLRAVDVGPGRRMEHEVEFPCDTVSPGGQ